MDGHGERFVAVARIAVEAEPNYAVIGGLHWHASYWQPEEVDLNTQYAVCLTVDEAVVMAQVVAAETGIYLNDEVMEL